MLRSGTTRVSSLSISSKNGGLKYFGNRCFNSSTGTSTTRQAVTMILWTSGRRTTATNKTMMYRRFLTTTNNSNRNKSTTQTKTTTTTATNGSSSSPSSSSSSPPSFREMLSSKWKQFLGPKPMPERWTVAWYKEVTLICTVFAITGSSTMVLVRPAVSNGLGLKGSMKDGPWSYRICSLVIMTPIYATLLVCVGTVFGRHFYFKVNYQK